MLKTFKDQGILMEQDERTMKDSQSHPNYVAPYLSDIPKSGIRDFFEIVSTRKDIISLGIGEPDFDTPWHIREATINALENGETSYTSNLGLLELREEICKYLKRFHLKYDPVTETIITVGVSEALDIAIRAITEPGDEIIYHEPSFVAYAPLIQMARGVAVPVTTTMDQQFRITRESLEAVVTPRTRALLLNFPTNPTGGVMRQEELQEIADFAIEHDLVVLTDEVYGELTYGAKHASIAAIPGMYERTIYLNGFSKAWSMTGFRIGFACAPPALLEAMMKIHQYSMMCASIISQRAAIEALKRGDEDVKNMRTSYEQRRHLICRELNEMGLKCHLPSGAFYAFPDISSTGLDSSTFAFRLIEEKNVACVPGAAFGESGEGFVRCCYATNVDLIKEAMSRMADFVASCKK